MKGILSHIWSHLDVLGEALGPKHLTAQMFFKVFGKSRFSVLGAVDPQFGRFWAQDGVQQILSGENTHTLPEKLPWVEGFWNLRPSQECQDGS